jgi:small GTP-binding protein
MLKKKQSIRYKFVIVGDSAVGKSCIATRYIQNHFYEFQEPTIGAAFMIKNLNIDEKEIKLEIWDTAGQERYRSLAPMYYRNANVALVVYDITKKSSFESAKIWIEEINRRSCPECIIVLLGNKYDLKKEIKINENEINDYIKHKNIMHFKTSAKTGLNIDNLFNTIINKLIEKNNNGIIKENNVSINNEIKQDRKCC